MTLKNGYKVLYEVVEDDNRVFKASKTGSLADADIISTIAKGTYKIVYEKAGKLYGGTSNVPTAEDIELTDFDAIFVEAVEEVTPANAEPEMEQPAAPQSEPEVVNPADEDEEEQIEE